MSDERTGAWASEARCVHGVPPCAECCLHEELFAARSRVTELEALRAHDIEAWQKEQVRVTELEAELEASRTETREATKLAEARERDFIAMRHRHDAQGLRGDRLASERDTYRDRLGVARGLLRAIEWLAYEGEMGWLPARCPVCEAFENDGHLDDCRLAAFLAGSPVSPTAEPSPDPYLYPTDHRTVHPAPVNGCPYCPGLPPGGEAAK